MAAKLFIITVKTEEAGAGHKEQIGMPFTEIPLLTPAVEFIECPARVCRINQISKRRNRQDMIQVGHQNFVWRRIGHPQITGTTLVPRNIGCDPQPCQI